MPPSTSWDETNPPESQNPALGATRIRELKAQLRERVTNGGMLWEVVGPSLNVNAGKLTCGVQGTTGVLNLAHEADGDVAIVVRDGTDAGGDAEVVLGTGVAGARPYELIVDAVTAATLVGAHTGAVAATTLTTSGNATLGDAAADAHTVNGSLDIANAALLLNHSLRFVQIRNAGDANYVVVAEDLVIVSTPVASNRTVTLQAVSAAGDGRVLIIVNRSTTATRQTNIVANAADTITKGNLITGGGGGMNLDIPGGANGFSWCAILVASLTFSTWLSLTHYTTADVG